MAVIEDLQHLSAVALQVSDSLADDAGFTWFDGHTVLEFVKPARHDVELRWRRPTVLLQSDAA